MSLFGQQRKFIQHYLSNNFDAPGAAKAAGYKFPNIEQNAQKLLDNPKIIKAIKQELNRRSQSFQIDKIFVLSNLVKTLNICLTTYIDDDGVECFKFPVLVDKGLKCVEKIGKCLGMFDSKETAEMPEINVINGIDKDEI